MIQELRIVALTLPDETQFRHDIQAINRFQAIVHQNLVENQDYGIIPGTQKPTLLKPGAEKIAKLLGLADQYEIEDRQEDWSKPFFRYLIRCKLIHVATQSLISEGLGECNSMESKYRYRWIGEKDLPLGTDKSKLVTQERRSKTGGHWTVYRLDNEDIFSQVNTILKMAKKRALVDAALSAGRLSNVFTQDIEDIPSIAQDIETEVVKTTKTKTPTEPEPTPENAGDKSSPAKEESNAVVSEEVKQPVKPSVARVGGEPKRDSSTLKTITDMYKACFTDFKIQPKEVMAELNITAWSQLTLTPAEAYQQISATR